MFNINKAVLKHLSDTIDFCGIAYIHGDGTITTKEDGSKYHREFNSGVDAKEKSNRASYWAVYKRGDKLPTSEHELEEAFYEQRKVDLKSINAPAQVSQGSQVFIPKAKTEVKEEVIEADLEPEIKKASGRPKTK